MTLVYIAALVVAAALLGFVKEPRWRLYLLLGASALAVYALQPALPVRGLDFYLPTLTLALAVLGWVLTTPRAERSWRSNWPAALILGAIVLTLALTRHLGFSLPLTASRPPQILIIALLLALATLLGFLLGRFSKPGKVALLGGFIFIILVFFLLKVPSISLQASVLLRTLTAQSLDTASALDIRWLGFSYIAFRLLHTIRDRQTGRLPSVSLAEYVTFLVFFPTLAAGPIDRLERFTADLRTAPVRTPEEIGEAGKRLLLGLFKKFAVADTLALIALNATNATQVHGAGWAWVLLYAYALQIYFDFSGYTDIAIGLGRLMGFKLPENFNAPYLKPNLTQFWNNWHITLTQWFRAYFFNPMTRLWRSGKRTLPVPVIILLFQVLTMVLIGLWHGATTNFVVWGSWHGLGLFVHNRWSELTSRRFAQLSPRWQKMLNMGGALLTFQFVALGWVFFALPSPEITARYLLILFGGA